MKHYYNKTRLHRNNHALEAFLKSFFFFEILSSLGTFWIFSIIALFLKSLFILLFALRHFCGIMDCNESRFLVHKVKFWKPQNGVRSSKLEYVWWQVFIIIYSLWNSQHGCAFCKSCWSGGLTLRVISETKKESPI